MSDDNSIQNIANIKIEKGILNWANHELTSGEVFITLPCGTSIEISSCTSNEDGRVIGSKMVVQNPSDEFKTMIYGQFDHTLKVRAEETINRCRQVHRSRTRIQDRKEGEPMKYEEKTKEELGYEELMEELE